MIVLLLLAVCLLSDAKSLTSAPSSSSPENSTEQSKLPAQAEKSNLSDYEDISPSTMPPRTVYHIDFTKDNGTEIVARRRTIFEVIPVDYLCDFCTAVIDKLKYRQSTEGADFEKNMLDECWKYNGTSGDDGNVCELVNKESRRAYTAQFTMRFGGFKAGEYRVNLDRLSKDKTLKICIDEKMCATKAKEIKAGKEEDQEEGEARRKQEEEEEKKYEEIENIKSEASRLEYEKHREEEKRKQAENARITHVHSENGDEEYVVDEVSKVEDDKNDYLDHSSQKLHSGQHRKAAIHITFQPVRAPKPPSSVRTTVAPPALVRLHAGEVSGVAQVLPNNQMVVNRTVKLKLVVEDLRRRR
ncbi:unnamed protein product [Heligmosomoides polygyrus]|uniref:DUF3456 domain-containing protein n=1 Tax=Heligmosomoides polygyrus TaxID=6339 RepID=A0A183GE52_HELPZ|nr:unnamed protein product [Heligmosomoides polygyrus]